MCVICENRYDDFLYIINFGVNVPCWCPFVHLFNTPIQNSPCGHDLNENQSLVNELLRLLLL